MAAPGARGMLLAADATGGLELAARGAAVVQRISSDRAGARTTTAATVTTTPTPSATWSRCG